MRIALVNKTISSSGGGAERYAVDLARELVRRGHEVHALACVLEDLPPQIFCHQIPKPPKPGFRKILGFPRNARRILDNLSVDVVYALTQMVPTDMYFVGGGLHRHWMTVRYPNRWLRWCRYWTNPTNLAQIWIEAQLAKPNNCRMMIANSHMIQRHCMQYGNVPPDRVTVIHNGVDPTTFNRADAMAQRDEQRKALNLKPNDLALLFVSHNWPRKGLASIMQAMAQLGETGTRYQLLVAGHGKVKRFSQHARSLQIHSRIRFLGSVSQPERLYAAADVFALPTWYDPCAGVTVEALACGLPVITTEANGASEMIRHGIDGYILPSPDHIDTLAEYLQNLTDDQRRAAMAQAAAENAADRTFARVVDQTLLVMQQLHET